ncbi:MAG: hypothetical protein KJO98_00895 [Rhodothermia bacterium]|nr:hypothetical protein [Rhodothermia bacterium]NNL47139.1 hypothetical protein [Acidimicrobiia bacterium]
MRRLVVIAPVLLLTAATFFSGVRLSYFNVESQGNEFVLTWETESEEQVDGFELHRRTSTTNHNFLLVDSHPAHGAKRTYTLRDDQVFKSGSELIDYRLQAVLADGSRQVLILKSVNYTPTAIRRTWGSIKAMF